MLDAKTLMVDVDPTHYAAMLPDPGMRNLHTSASPAPTWLQVAEMTLIMFLFQQLVQQLYVGFCSIWQGSVRQPEQTMMMSRLFSTLRVRRDTFSFHLCGTLDIYHTHKCERASSDVPFSCRS